MTSFTQAHRLDARKTFLELMRRVEALHTEQGWASQQRRRPDWLRLSQAASMRFASSEVASVHAQPGGDAQETFPVSLEVVTRHFGLFAPYGPLPLHLTEHAMAERHFERNTAFEAFVNLVSAEFAWLHYCASSAMHPLLGLERLRQPFQERVTSLGSTDWTTSDGDPQAHVRACRQAYPGVYFNRRRSAAMLQRVLQAHFQVPIRITPRAGRWCHLPPKATHPTVLGQWRLGTRMWDAHSAVDVEVGPLDAMALTDWNRRAPNTQALRAVVLDYSDGRIHPQIHLHLRTQADMATRVGQLRLGVHAWLRPTHATQRVTVHNAPQDIQ